MLSSFTDTSASHHLYNLHEYGEDYTFNYITKILHVFISSFLIKARALHFIFFSPPPPPPPIQQFSVGCWRTALSTALFLLIIL